MSHPQDPHGAPDKPVRQDPRNASVRATASIGSMRPRDLVALSLLIKKDSAGKRR